MNNTYAYAGFLEQRVCFANFDVTLPNIFRHTDVSTEKKIARKKPAKNSTAINMPR